LGQPSPPAFFLYIDQGEELYVRAEKGQRRRFSEIIATGLADPRLRALMSLRADFFGELLNDEALYRVHRLVKVPPLREAQLREVVSNPAKLLSARFQSDTLAADVARRAAEESADDTGALPLLSYLLDDMWSEMVERGDGMLRLPMQAIDLGLVLVERADRFIAERPAAEAALRRILTLKLATVREDGEPTRRRAARSEFGDEEWRLVSELADHPNRLLVTATPEGGETYAEVAHEAIFRRWDKLREWTAGEREFLAWKTGLEAARRAWQATPDDSKSDALLMGAALTQARSWWTKRGEDLTVGDRDFIDQSRRRESKARARARRAQAAIGVLMLGTIAGLLGVIFKDEFNAARFEFFTARPYVAANFTPHVLTPQAERALPPGASFRECAAGSRACPEMVVVPAGTFRMGSPDEEAGRHTSEEPVRTVTIPRPFAVGKFEVTWDEWEACVAMRGCDGRPTLDQGYGRGRKPVINVSWEQAKAYVAWLSRMTGKIYRLLTEAEWEYAARGVIGADAPHPPYPWDDDPAGLCRHANLADQSYRGVGYAGDIVNCDDGHAVTAAVGSYPANAFGLQDMHGNVWEWVEDGWHSSYAGSPPSNGSEWKDGADVSRRVVRGGCWFDDPRNLRSAVRDGFTSVDRFNGLGFRVARTLDR
jgi:formylglycine-generating enzyme required for sulfatase activity